MDAPTQPAGTGSTPDDSPPTNRGYEAFHRPRFEFLLSVLDRHLPKQKARVLDVGQSALTGLMANRLAVHVDCLGLEEDGVLLEGGRRYHFDLNDAQHRQRWRLDFGPYDVIVFAEVIEHLYTAPELVLAYLRELLVPGGLILVQTPNAASLRKRVKLALGQNPFERIRTDISNPGHFREYTASELREILAGAGFDVCQVWSRFYFDARYARHERGDEPPRLIRGSIQNALYRMLPTSLREGITLLARRQ